MPNIPSSSDLTKMAINRIKSGGGVTKNKQADPVGQGPAINDKQIKITQQKGPTPPKVNGVNSFVPKTNNMGDAWKKGKK